MTWSAAGTAGAEPSGYSPAPASCRIHLGHPGPGNPGRPMYRLLAPHISENELYLKLFITNGGGW
jgi:hypothetical protein